MNSRVQDNLNMRLNYLGGNAEGRFQRDKLTSLKRALLYSYQAETAILKDGRMFRCLLNPNKLKADYDIKELSIPYKDICIGRNGVGEPFDPDKFDKNSFGQEEIGVAPGDVFQIEKDNTRWIITDEFLEEDSYFRGEVYRCEDEPVEINGIPYYVHLRGPNETTIQWNQKRGIVWNDLNYSMIMYITKDENTLSALHRFSKIKIKEDGRDVLKNWQVAAVNPYYHEGIIEVMLDEYYDDIPEDLEEQNAEPQVTFISGPDSIYPFDTFTYTVESGGGQWQLDKDVADKVKVVQLSDTRIDLYIKYGRHFNFELRYLLNNEVLPININVNSL